MTELDDIAESIGTLEQSQDTDSHDRLHTDDVSVERDMDSYDGGL